MNTGSGSVGSNFIWEISSSCRVTGEHDGSVVVSTVDGTDGCGVGDGVIDCRRAALGSATNDGVVVGSRASAIEDD